MRVDERAARASTRVALALGSKSPNVVFDDAVIEDALKGAISGIFAATGQTRIVGSRLLVQRSVHNEFIDKLVAFPLTAKTGDPTTYDTQVGPMTTPSQYKKILDYIAAGRAEGAQVALGGSREAADKERFCLAGWFIEPTMFAGVNNKKRLAQRKIFGPVLSVVPFANDVATANDTPYGLTAGMGTQAIRRSIILSERPGVGTVRGQHLSCALGANSAVVSAARMGRTPSTYIAAEERVGQRADEVPNPFVMR